MQVLLREDSPSSLTALAQINNETYQYRNHQFEIPVRILQNGSTLYQAEMCGFEIESKQKEEIPQLVQNLLNQLINVGRLPDYVFVAKRAKQIVPVYTIGNDVTVKIPNGPLFRHEELAKIRGWVTDYLHEIKVLGHEGLSDKLHVRGINQADLSLNRPIFYLKKYNVDEERFWAPVFSDEAKETIYTHAADNQREVKKRGGQEVIDLQKLVGELLITRDRLSELHDLRADRLRPTYWTELKSQLTPLDNPLTLGSYTLKTYTYKQDYIAIEHRLDERETEDRYGLYFGESIEDLSKRVEIDFKRRSLI